MRRISRGFGCVLIALAASTSLAACRDWATGQGGNGLNPTVVNLDASSGPSGESPIGTLSFHFGGGNGPDWHGDVSCLSVSGHTAIIGFGNGDYHDLSVTYWVSGLVRVVDNGPTGDTFEYVELKTGEPGPRPGPPPGDPLPGPTDCSSFPTDRTVYDIAQGGFQVVDGQPVTPSKN
jgi:hypothetical protein